MKVYREFESHPFRHFLTQPNVHPPYFACDAPEIGFAAERDRQFPAGFPHLSLRNLESDEQALSLAYQKTSKDRMVSTIIGNFALDHPLIMISKCMRAKAWCCIGIVTACDGIKHEHGFAGIIKADAG